MITALLIIGYLVSAILTYGMSYAFLYAEDEDAINKDYAESQKRLSIGGSVLFATLSPLATFIVFCLSGFAKHGLKFR